jgi:hypothetical protein
MTTRLWLTLGRMLKLVQILGEEREPTSVYPDDEKAVYDNGNDSCDDDRDLE